MGIKHLNRYLQNNCHDGIKKIPFYELSEKKLQSIQVYIYIDFWAKMRY